MKTMKLIYPLAMALAITLAGAGCKHQPTNMIKLGPSPGAPNVGDQQPQQPPTIPPGNPYTSEVPPVFTPINPPSIIGGGITSTNWDITDTNLIRDAATLAIDTVHFAFDSAAVKDSEQAHVKAVADALTSEPNVKLLIEGNCDERGTEEYNRSLGERRALALREALAKLGIDAQRVRTISYGKDQPADPGHTEEAFAKNRRGDFVLYHPKPGM